MVIYVQWEMVVKEVLEDEYNFRKANGKKHAAKKELKKRLKFIKVTHLAKCCEEGSQGTLAQKLCDESCNF